MVGLFVSVPSLVSSLLFLIGLFMPVPFLMGLCICAFFGYSVILFDRSICTCAFSGGSVYLYLLLLLCCSFWWVYLCLLIGLCLLRLVRCSFRLVCLYCMPFSMSLCICTFSGYSIILFSESICACQWVCAFYG